MTCLFCSLVVRLISQYSTTTIFIKTYDTSYFAGINARKIKLSITTAVMVLVVIGITLTLTTFAAISTSQNVPSEGTVITSANLGVYSNSLCTTTLSSISWGNLTAGSTKTQTIYIKNTGSGLSLTLSMATSNLTPSGAVGYITEKVG